MVNNLMTINEILLIQNQNKSNILSVICQFNHIDLFQLLLNKDIMFINALKHIDNNGLDAIFEALNSGSWEIVHLLCDKYPSLILNYGESSRNSVC